MAGSCGTRTPVTSISIIRSTTSVSFATSKHGTLGALCSLPTPESPVRKRYRPRVTCAVARIVYSGSSSTPLEATG